ncbi:hypothetical protein NDN08_000911 [Rhodosorus marinus]|uniref:Tyrosine specific protein phosphatases domain-containing protein n=1 Tax=Rhodosorus marinus TaxID=101924 RepID=A0AAV8UTD5_9RHOD|nr:hypothetical protein NDN08_000911 [Rhodosorus marinus]
MGFVGVAGVGGYGRRSRSVCRRTRIVAVAVAPRQIGDDYWIGGNVSEEAISELSPKSVMLLKTSAEEGVTAEEVQKFCVEKGIDMKWVPVAPKMADRELADEIVNLLSAQEKPVLIECASGVRAGAALSIYMARENGMSFEEIRELAVEQAMNWPEVPPLAKWVSESV